jgi:hypothetical protein
MSLVMNDCDNLSYYINSRSKGKRFFVFSAIDLEQYNQMAANLVTMEQLNHLGWYEVCGLKDRLIYLRRE